MKWFHLFQTGKFYATHVKQLLMFSILSILSFSLTYLIADITVF